MESKPNWPVILKASYYRTHAEEQAFIRALCDSTLNETLIRKTYESIKNDERVQAGLRTMYHEAVYGTNRVVIKHIRDRISHFKTDHK